MRKDDSTLSHAERSFVEGRAKLLLQRADAFGVVPVPIDDLLSAAKLKVAPTSLFDPRAVAAYAVAQGKRAAEVVKKALGKILGILDAHEEVIHIDDTVSEGRQSFLKLHETGHFELPHQRKIFRFFEDSQDELDPSIADKFEREANNFARYAIFNGTAYADRAADLPLAFSSVKKMQRNFKVSLYAGLREYARTHRHICLAMAVEKPTLCPTKGWNSEIRRVETSLAFEEQFGQPQVPIITKHHPLWALVPFGKAVRPTIVRLNDLNGQTHEFIGEALDTGYNILIFACPAALFKN